MAAVCLMSAMGLTQAGLIAYWNFNDTAYTTPSSGTATLDLSGASGACQSSDGGTTQNALNKDSGLKTLLIAGGNGQTVVFSLSMSGLQNLQLSYATVKSTTGFNQQVWSYSTDDSTFTAQATISGDASIPPYSSGPVSSDYAVDTVSFSSITALNNNSTIWIKLALNEGTGGSDRFDNIQFNADVSAVPEPVETGAIAVTGLLGLCTLHEWRQHIATRRKTEGQKLES